MEMFHQASMKLGLDRAVLAHARSEQGGEEPGSKGAEFAAKLSLKEIDNLLKRGAYDVFREDDNDQNEFVEADIDSILQRRAHKVVYNEAGGMTNTLGSFSKASFVSADEKGDVDINDPDFWKKAIGLKEESAGELHEYEETEILPMQRNRKQTKVYGDLHNENDLYFKKIMKPVKSAKADREEKLALKAAQKEAQLRERREREEAKKAKAIEEAKMKCDPKTWGSHGRDRVLRSLNMYGFGRWERIRAETGKEMMDIKDLEMFCRAYVLKCGLCAGEQELNKNDSQYVRDAILAAKEIDNLAKSGEKKLDIPPSLTEAKFLGKLRSGLARKSLNKLDALAKLIVLMREVIANAYLAKFGNDDSELSIDQKFNALTIKEVETCLPFGEVRPSWARSCPWWNLDCDKHLVIGVFKHGFGRYDLIKEDGDLIFRDMLAEQKVVANLKQEALVVPTEGGGEVVQIKKEEEKDDVKAEAMEVDDGALGADDQALLDKMEEQEPDPDVDEDMLAPESSKSGAQNTQPGYLPDPRHLNRIIVWLLSSELARMSKAEYVEHQKKERKPRDSRKGLDYLDGNITSSPSQPATYYMLIEGEQKLLSCFREFMDADSMCMSFRPTTRGIGKCQYMLTVPSLPATKSTKKNSTDDVKKDETDAMDVAEEGVDTKPESEVEQVLITELDAVKLSAALILYTAPLPYSFYDYLFQKLKGIIGIESAASTDVKNEDDTVKSYFCWKTIKERSGVLIQEVAIEVFYRSIFLPFCENILKHKHLTTNSAKYLIPNPLLSPHDHHVAAKGLCQLFIMRQQLSYSIQYILCNSLRGLMEYLRSPQGRGVDNMPVWWCPWIHDLALLLGFLKHGYLALPQIFADPHLPFHEKFVKALVTKVFVTGTDHVPAVGRFDLRTPEEAEEFVRVTTQHKPDPRDVEIRVIRIIEEMTKTFPNENMFKINMSSTLFRSIIGVSYLSPEAAESYTANGKVKGDTKSKGSTARPPAISLKTFVKTTKKRRKQYLASYHQDLLMNSKLDDSYSEDYVIDMAVLTALELGEVPPTAPQQAKQAPAVDAKETEDVAGNPDQLSFDADIKQERELPSPIAATEQA
jgi:hypothetical protein